MLDEMIQITNNNQTFKFLGRIFWFFFPPIAINCENPYLILFLRQLW